MALAKKGTRSMTVEGTRYRWVVAPNDEPGLGIVVEAADAPGQRMVTWVEHGTTISPWLVREAILHALAHGWQPRARGPERVFRFDAPFIHQALSRRLESRLYGLCDAFQGRVQGLEGVREFMKVGERALAFDTLCDRFLSADDVPELSLSELEQLAELGEELRCRSEWVDLIRCLKPTDRKRIPPRLRTLATNQLESELARNPIPARQEWLRRLRALLGPGRDESGSENPGPGNRRGSRRG